jgi:hypothetical protein
MAENPTKEYYFALNTASRGVIEAATTDPSSLGPAQQFLDDLQTWRDVLTPRPEAIVLGHSITEATLGLFSLVSGVYRAAFGSLRLFLELSLSTQYFSVNRLELAEWKKGTGDITWSSLIDSDNGVLSHRYAGAFLPELGPHVMVYNTLARTLYRELSEFVHGNHATLGLVSDEIAFDSDLHQRWLANFTTAKTIISFALCLRFLSELPAQARPSLTNTIMSTLGHLDVIRQVLGAS